MIYVIGVVREFAIVSMVGLVIGLVCCEEVCIVLCVVLIIYGWC